MNSKPEWKWLEEALPNLKKRLWEQRNEECWGKFEMAQGDLS